MAVLPDRTVFGNAPSGLSGRPGVDYTGAVAPGRQNIETASRSGEGLKALGRGLEVAGNQALRYAAVEAERDDQIALTEAKTTALINASNLEESLANETDPKRIAETYPSAFQNAFAVSGQNLSPRAQKEYELWSATHINTGMHAVNGRVRGLEKDQGIARLDEELKSLGLAGIQKGAPEQAGEYIKQAGDQIDVAYKKGWITAEHAFKLKEQWAQNFQVNSVMSKPPEERLRILGVTPRNVNEAAGEGVKFFMSKGWSPHQAAAIVGGLIHESSLNPNARNRGDGSDGSDSIGIGQWNQQRAKNLQAFAAAAGKSWNDIGVQFAFVQHELETNEAAAAAALRGAGNLEAAAGAFLKYERPKGYEGGLATASGGRARLAHARRIVGAIGKDGGFNTNPSMDGAYEIADNPLVTGMNPSTRHSLTVQAINDYNREHHERQIGVEQARADIRQKMEDDKLSLQSTGKASDLTTDQVRTVFGEEQAKHFQAEREIAQTYYAQTHDFSQIPSEEIARRIEQMRPTEENSDAPGFKLRKTLYDKAVKEAKEQIKERNQDPAAAADRTPEVAAIKQKADLGDENAPRELARARMRAFDMLRIPESRQVPMTRQEAKDIMAPVMEAIGDKPTRAALEAVTKQIQAIYGDDMTSRVLGFALETARADQDTTKAAASVIKKLFQKPAAPAVPPEAAERAVKEAAEVDAMRKFVDPSPDFGGFSTPDAWAAEEAAKPAAKKYPIPNNSAVRALIGQPTPERAAQFDELFGPGAAAKIMKQAGVETQEMKRPPSPALLGGNS